MSIITSVAQPVNVGGVDAHKDTHHVVVLDGHGIRLADQAFPATLAGYQQLLNWLRSVGSIDRVGIESSGSYGAGLARFLESQQIRVLEVNTPHAHTRAKKGKDDLIDAEAAARKVLSGEASALPKVTTGVIESIRLLRIALRISGQGAQCGTRATTRRLDYSALSAT
jgi:transposase